MRVPVAVVAFSQLPSVRSEERKNEVEMVMKATSSVLEQVEMAGNQMGFICSGSSDYMAGLSFSFVTSLDAVGPWPPVSESHVEMDGAWALYEAVIRLQHGDIDTALVYGFGKASLGELRNVLCLQLEPYCLAPLWPDSVSLAALQAQQCLSSGAVTADEMLQVVQRSRNNALTNPNAQLKGAHTIDELAAEPYFVEPLRKHDCPPISDSAAAIVLATGEKARKLAKHPAWITGIDHRIDHHHLGMRDLSRVPSAERAAQEAGVFDKTPDLAELHAPFSHQEVLLTNAMKLSPSVAINPSGGALAANPMMSAGLIRVGEAAQRILDGQAGVAVAHATSGPCLQQNLVAVLEGSHE